MKAIAYYIYLLSIFYVLSINNVFITGYFKNRNNSILLIIFKYIKYIINFIINGVLFITREDKLIENNNEFFIMKMFRLVELLITKESPNNIKLFGLEIILTYIIILTIMYIFYFIFHMLISSSLSNPFSFSNYICHLEILIPHSITYLLFLIIDRKGDDDFQYIIQSILYLLTAISYLTTDMFNVDLDKIYNIKFIKENIDKTKTFVKESKDLMKNKLINRYKMSENKIDI